MRFESLESNEKLMMSNSATNILIYNILYRVNILRVAISQIVFVVTVFLDIREIYTLFCQPTLNLVSDIFSRKISKLQTYSTIQYEIATASQ